MVYKKFKYISICYHQNIDSISQMFLEHYDVPEYDDTLFLLNTPCKNNKWLSRGDFVESKIIFYNLEHLEVTYNFFNEYYKSIIQWLNDMQLYEIWDFCIENIKYYPEYLRDITKFIPIRYTESLYDNPLDIPKRYDLGFVGVLQTKHMHRLNIISDIQLLHELNPEYKDVSFKIIKGNPISQLKDELSDCKYIFDTLNHKETYSHICTQNQVRIFECIMRGYNVISESINGINYFPGIINIFDYPADDERISGYVYGIPLLEMLSNNYEDNHIENRENYKKMTYRDEDFENYKNNIIEQYKQL